MANAIRQFTESKRMASSLFNRVRSHRYYPIGIIGLFLLVISCVHIWQRVVVIQLVKEVSQLRAEQRQYVDDSRKVESDIAALSMAARIETYSRDSLGLQLISADRLITLVREEPRHITQDELATMISSIKRVASYLPTVEPAEASANVLETTRRDVSRVEDR